MLCLCVCVSCDFTFFFFFFNFSAAALISGDNGYCLWIVAATLDYFNPQISLFNNFFIKNGSHGTIHTFTNYFTTVFSVFNFQFQQNKLYPNGPLVYLLFKTSYIRLYILYYILLKYYFFLILSLLLIPLHFA